MELKQPDVLDILPTGAPALSSTSDMPVVETKPDASPEVPAAPEPEVEETEGAEAEQPGESATPATDGQSGQPTSERGVGKALAKLRAEVKEAERKAQEEREERIRLEERLKVKPVVPEPVVVEDAEPIKPRQDDFPDPKSWEEALLSYADQRSEWAARKAVAASNAEATRQREHEQIAAGIKKAQDEFAARLTTYKQAHPDFDEVVAASQVKVPQVAVQAIINHPMGPALQHHFAMHPEDATRLLGIQGDLQQALELGSIIGRLSTPVVLKPSVSNAPPPIKPIKAAGETSTKNPEEESMEEYANRRNKELRGGRDMRH